MIQVDNSFELVKQLVYDNFWASNVIKSFSREKFTITVLFPLPKKKKKSSYK